MHLSEIIGQSHAYRLGQLLIEQRPKMILISGPLGCGKTSYAEAVVNGIGGDGARYRSVPDELDGRWTIINQTSPFSKDEWGRLIDLVNNSSDHTVLLTTSELDSVPRAVQSLAVRVVLRAITEGDLRAYAENLLVRAQIPYSPQALDRLIVRAAGNIISVQNMVSLAILNNGLSDSLLHALGEDLRLAVQEIFRYLADGFLPEAKAKADSICASYSVREMVNELLEQYAKAWSPSPSPLGSRIKHRFPNPPATTMVLLKWAQSPHGALGSVIITELDLTGIKVEDPRVVEARRKEEAERAEKMLKGRPELQLDPSLLAGRKNTDLPLYEDKSIPMDPRVREKLRSEAAEVERKKSKIAHLQPSAIITTSSLGDHNPFGTRMPDPGSVPKGTVLGTQFAKLARARKLSPEEKWDLVYREREINSDVRASVITLMVEADAEIFAEDNQGITIRANKSYLPEFLELDNCEVSTCV